MKNLAVVFITFMVFGILGVTESHAGRFEKNYSKQHYRTDHHMAGSMHDGHLSVRERNRLEHRQNLANRHYNRMRHNDRNTRDRNRYDHVSVRSSSVVIPLLLPPLPPPPIVFPGMHIRIFSR